MNTFVKIKHFLDTKCQPHYLVIGRYTKEVIGCCRGREGKRQALEQEPGSAFKLCSACKCPVCNEEE